MIEFYHVDKQYVKDQFALRDINLTIEKGEFAFLTGASGAGKSTLLKLIYREEMPTRGQILIDSTNMSLVPRSEIYRFRRLIGVVFQDFKLLETRTVAENVGIPLMVRGERRSVVDKMVQSTLSMVGLNHRRNYLPPHLSGGEQQRVAIARAIAGNPKILLADEPTGNLDTDLSFEIMELFERINANGITVLLATHDKLMLKEFPHRIIRLENGRVAQGMPTPVSLREVPAP